MKYFLDTEFIEDGKTIDLISIGLVSEQESEVLGDYVYYAVNSNCNFRRADPWVRENVLKPIGIEVTRFGVKIRDRSDFVPKKQIARDILHRILAPYCGASFIIDRPISFLKDRELPEGQKPEFWGEWCATDWVVFYQLFGRMVDSPRCFPFLCRDVIQLAEFKGYKPEDLPPSLETDGNHHALLGARTVKKRYEWLVSH